MMIVVRSRNANKPSFVFPGVSEGQHSLITPHLVSGGRLVAVKEGVNWRLLIVAGTVHKAKAIKGALQILAFPQFLKKRHHPFSELPLRLGVANVLNHASMEDGWVILTEDLSFGFVSIKSAISQYLHDSPKVLHVFLTFLLGKPVGDYNKTFFIQVLAPSILILKGKTIFLIILHCTQKKNYNMYQDKRDFLNWINEVTLGAYFD